VKACASMEWQHQEAALPFSTSLIRDTRTTVHPSNRNAHKDDDSWSNSRSRWREARNSIFVRGNPDYGTEDRKKNGAFAPHHKPTIDENMLN